MSQAVTPPEKIEELAREIFTQAVAIAMASYRGANVYPKGAELSFQAAQAFYDYAAQWPNTQQLPRMSFP